MKSKLSIIKNLNIKNSLKISNFKFQILSIAFLTVMSFTPSDAIAHTLKTDGSIGVVMHVDPDDDPIVGKQSNFFFEFKDKNNIFDPNNCGCAFSILQNGKVLYSQPLFQNSEKSEVKSAGAVYFFAERGVYTVRLTGQPKNGQSFAPFTIDNDLRVTRVAEAAKTTENTSWLTEHLSVIIGGVIGLLIVSFVLIKSRKNEK